MEIALYQMKMIPGQPEQAMAQIEAWFRMISADIAVLPEMWNTSYKLDELQQLAVENGSREIDFLCRLARQHHINVVGGSIAVKENGDVFNRAVVINRRGEVVYTYDKVHLVPMLHEPEYLTAGDSIETFELEGCQMGMIICYDLRFPELSRKLALEGAEVLFVTAEWPASRIDAFQKLNYARAIENQCYVVACNAVGTCDDTVMGGQSMIVDPEGQLVASLTDEEETLTADLQLDRVQHMRQMIPIFETRRPDIY